MVMDFIIDIQFILNHKHLNYLYYKCSRINEDEAHIIFEIILNEINEYVHYIAKIYKFFI